MIRRLTFGSPRGRVREPAFVPVAHLPLAAARTLALGLRAEIARLYGRTIDVVAAPPAALEPAAWATIASGAYLYAVRGSSTDCALVVRASDAVRFVAAAFGEDAAFEARALSPLEDAALERLFAVAASAATTFCGEVHGSTRVAASAFPVPAVYLDVRFGPPLDAAIGFAPVRDPAPPVEGALAPTLLDEIELDVHATFAHRNLTFAELCTLRPGLIVRTDTKVGAAATLNIGDASVASGVCGVSGSNAAFLIGT